MAMEKNKTGSVVELTLRGLVLGVLITLVFTAANVYLGLKVGLTFVTSIPAAVISMAVLSAFRGSTVLENNIVQTVASAAGAIASIIFVLPGLVIVGWWSGFPYWTSFLICASGGILGVLFTIPLRRALVTNSDLPYPEGVAAAEVVKVGSHEHPEDASQSQEGLLALIYGTLASAGMAIFAATQFAAAEFQSFFRFGSSASGYNFAFSFALFGAGHLVGLSVGMAMLLGTLIAWGAAVPILTALHPMADQAQALGTYVTGIWRHDVRFIGAGCIAIAALWTLVRLAGPVVRGLVSTMTTLRLRHDANSDARDTDISGGVIIALTVLSLAVVAWLSFDFVKNTALSGDAIVLTAITLPFVLLVGFVIAAICGYMAGLIGSSNSPISSVCILAVVAGATLFAAVVHVTPENQQPLIAFALFATSIICAISVSSNDNLQDLKTGQLVGAAPWRQQVALLVGMLAGSAVIPPVLNLLAQAYGFLGQAVLPSATLQPLGAPQAGLMSALAQGVIGHQLDWAMIGIGIAVGIAVIVLDEFMGARKLLRLPPLAVGIAIYLPMSATAFVIIGSVVGHMYRNFARRTPDPEHTKRLGVLVASGMIVGESLFGVALAGLIVGLSQDTPLALAPGDFAWADIVGVASFVVLLVVLYGWMMRRSRMAPNAS